MIPRRLLLVSALLLGACTSGGGGENYSEAITAPASAPNRTRLAAEFETPTTSTRLGPPSTRASRDGRRPRPPVPSSPPVVGGSPASQGSGVWDALARCESGNRWNANTGNGYFGGLQMDMSFWRSYGGGVAPRPDLASREQQIAAAERARDSGRGYHPWPTCARRLGLV